MGVVDLRELRQHAGELVRRAEAGERVTVTVAGRPVALLGPATPRVWRRWSDFADVSGAGLIGIGLKTGISSRTP